MKSIKNCLICGDRFESKRENNTVCKKLECKRIRKAQLQKIERRKNNDILKAERKKAKQVRTLQKIYEKRIKQEGEFKRPSNADVEKKYFATVLQFTDEQKEAGRQLKEISQLAYNKTMPYLNSDDFEELNLRVFTFFGIWLHGHALHEAKRLAIIITKKSMVPLPNQDIKFYSTKERKNG